jgi:ferric-dicitrate binding protein FerR (iron transport regulator)
MDPRPASRRAAAAVALLLLLAASPSAVTAAAIHGGGWQEAHATFYGDETGAETMRELLDSTTDMLALCAFC